MVYVSTCELASVAEYFTVHRYNRLNIKDKMHVGIRWDSYTKQNSRSEAGAERHAYNANKRDHYHEHTPPARQ